MRLQYQCETCNFIYPEQWMAQICESQPPTLPKHVAGDKIAFRTRYEGVQYDRVKRVIALQGQWCDTMSGWVGQESKFMARLEEEGYERAHFHVWGYEVTEYHYLSKDQGTFVIPESSLEIER